MTQAETGQPVEPLSLAKKKGLGVIRAELNAVKVAEDSGRPAAAEYHLVKARAMEDVLLIANVISGEDVESLHSPQPKE